MLSFPILHNAAIHSAAFHGEAAARRVGLALWIIAAIGSPALSQATSEQAAPPPGAVGGCWSMGKWYPEGSVQTPDPRSRIAVSGSFVCREGKWVLETNAR